MKIANAGTSTEPVDSLTPHPRNPNRGNVAAIAESIGVHGFYGHVVVQKSSRTILAGEHRWRAAQASGLAEIPVTWLDVDDEQALRIVLADNRTAELASRDPSGLVALLQELAATPTALAGTGYDDDTLAELLASLKPKPEHNEDAVTDPPPIPVTQPGDLWELGEHRLLCGDATKPEDVDRVLDTAVSTVFTDPPYGVGYEAMRGGKAIANDGSEAEAHQVLALAIGVIDATEWFVCCNWRSLGTVLGVLGAVHLEPKACIVWDKGRRVQNLDRFAKQHEFIVYSGPFGGEPTVDVDLWTVPRDFDPEHPTPKPPALVERALQTSHGAVYDPFGGSGSTLIAAEQTGRIARLIELDPGYCDVICRRYQNLTGTKPVRNGEPVDFLT